MRNFLRRWWPLLAVFAFTFACSAYVMAHRGFSPANEARYISIVDDMLFGGRWFTLYVDGAMYTDKPPFFFQIIALLRLLFGSYCPLALYGISFISACGIAWVMDWAFCREGDGVLKRATLALAFMTSGLVMGEAMFLRMDLLMTLFIVGALAVFHKSGGRYSWWIPICIFMALYTKGPMGLAMPVVAILVFLLLRRDYKAVGLYFGWRTWLVVGGLSVVWFAMAWMEGGREYVESLVFGQISSRVFHGSVHNAPWYYYLWVLPLCVLPLTPLWLTAVIHPVKANRGALRELPEAVLLMLTAVVSSLLMLSVTPSKLAIYITPIVPFGVWLIGFLPMENKTVRSLFKLTCCLPFVMALAVLVCMLLGPRFSLLGPYGFFYLCTTGYVAAAVMLVVSACGAVMALVPCASQRLCQTDRLWLGLLISLSSFWLILAAASPLINVYNAL